MVWMDKVVNCNYVKGWKIILLAWCYVSGGCGVFSAGWGVVGLDINPLIVLCSQC